MFKMTREFYIPKSAIKVSDKHSDAVAYLTINSKGKPRATIFVGKQAKPLSDYYYSTEKARENAVGIAFESRRKSLAFKAESMAKRRAYENHYKVGDILNTCWGYDQTNREFFEVVELRGKHVMLRELAQERVEDGWLSGKCVPLAGSYIGEPIRRLAQEHGIKIDDVRWASLTSTTNVAGVKVASPQSWSAYH